METNNKKWLFLLVLALIWGSSFILIKRGLVGLTPIQLGSLRIIFSAIFLLVIGFKTLPQIPQNKWKYIALTGLFGTFIPAFLFAIAQTQIDSSISSILNSLTPMNTLLIGILAFGLTPKRSQIIGVIIGLVGSAILILNGAATHPEQNYYAILVIIASICYATNVNLLKKYLSDLSPLSISTGNFSVMLLPALLILSFSDFFQVFQLPQTQHSMLFVLILGVVGTGIANIIFFKLIQISSPVFATSVTYLIPVVAFFWGLVDSEVLSAIQLVGALIILFGVYLSSKK
ncbi:MAG: DMT family transporter [Flavobacterium sp.]|uniref:DMT family transporter n=1 Tax=Flavobacterium sp. TaxID=239 RepID=UPI0022BB5E0C|nr:DMT family transporter [Flavobacterium sp.]MCZ8197724.1 DMT family transporter [Flavobacterium sp.]